ncbi:MAG: formate dehydrogenase subunit gamma [Herminiimonas sp.]|nr:formate dehydrogenase subunit gamma [Herminiimonas sp.]
MLMLVAMLAALLPSVCFAAVPNKDAVPAYAEEQAIFQTEKGVPDGSWSSPESGKVHIDRHYLGQYGATEGTVILQRGGNTWRKLRDGPIATLSSVLLLAVPLLIFGFYNWSARPGLNTPNPAGRSADGVAMPGEIHVWLSRYLLEHYQPRARGGRQHG